MSSASPISPILRDDLVNFTEMRAWANKLAPKRALEYHYLFNAAEGKLRGGKSTYDSVEKCIAAGVDILASDNDYECPYNCFYSLRGRNVLYYISRFEISQSSAINTIGFIFTIAQAQGKLPQLFTHVDASKRTPAHYLFSSKWISPTCFYNIHQFLDFTSQSENGRNALHDFFSEFNIYTISPENVAKLNTALNAVKCKAVISATQGSGGTAAAAASTITTFNIAKTEGSEKQADDKFINAKDENGFTPLYILYSQFAVRTENRQLHNMARLTPEQITICANLQANWLNTIASCKHLMQQAGADMSLVVDSSNYEHEGEEKLKQGKEILRRICDAASAKVFGVTLTLKQSGVQNQSAAAGASPARALIGQGAGSASSAAAAAVSSPKQLIGTPVHSEQQNQYHVPIPHAVSMAMLRPQAMVASAIQPPSSSPFAISVTTPKGTTSACGMEQSDK